PADVDQVALGVDLLDAEVSLCVSLVAIVTRHALALDDARRIGARADRARTAMFRVAVRVRTAAGAVALHDALEAVSPRRAGDLHRVAHGEDVALHEVADVVRRDLRFRVPRLVEPHRSQHARRRLEPGLLGVADRGERRAMSLRRALAPLRRTA